MNGFKLLEPIQIGRRTVKNRIVMPPMECRFNTVDGSPTQLMVDYYEARAKGGTGMIIVENTFVDDLESRSSAASSGLYNDHQISAKAVLAEAIKEHGALALIQLSHGGRQASLAATGLECVAPSPIPCKVTGRMPRELTECEIKRIENDFARAAVRAKKAGFDGVEIHGAHGYLLMEFLSPYTNKRTDKYGGSFENRMRMPKEVVQKVRESVGRDFIIGFRISVDEYIGNEGLLPRESCAFITEIQELIDYVHCSAGNYETEPFCLTCSTYEPMGKLIPLADEMKKHVSIPVIAVGSFDARLGEDVLRSCKADMAAFGRQHIAEPEFAKKLYEGRIDDIRPCCRANEGCTSGFANGYPIRCELNPAVGRERRFELKKAEKKKRVVVIGGGCAGMEAARVADRMGHDVTLLEKSDRFGGHLIEAVVPPFKNKTADALKWLIRQVQNSGIKAELNADTSPERIVSLNPDAVILAVGSKYATPPVKGVEHAVYADDALLHQEKTGKNVVVIGGGLVGVETALTLAENRGANVSIVEMLGGLSYNMDGNARRAMLKRIEMDGIRVFCSTTVSEIRHASVVCKGIGEETTEIPSDTTVIAVGLKADSNEVEKYSALGIKTIKIGDCKQARSISKCLYEAWCAAFELNTY